MFQLGLATAVAAALAVTPAPTPEAGSTPRVAAVAIFFGDSLSMGFLDVDPPNPPGVNPVLNDDTIQVNAAWVESVDTRYGPPLNTGPNAGMTPSTDWYSVDDTQGFDFVSASPVFGFATKIRAVIDTRQAAQPEEIFCIQLGIGSSHAAPNPMQGNSHFTWNPTAVNGPTTDAMFDQLVDHHVRDSIGDLLSNFDEVQLIGVFGSCGGGYIQGNADPSWLAQYVGHMDEIRAGFGALFNLSSADTSSFPMGLFRWHDANPQTFLPVLQKKLRIVQDVWAKDGPDNDFLVIPSLAAGLTSDGVHFTETTTIAAGASWALGLVDNWSPVPITSVN